MLRLSLLALSLGVSHGKSLLEDDHSAFRPSLALSSLNGSDLPLRLLPAPGPEGRRSGTFEQDFDEIGIGNLDYTGSYEEDLREVRSLLADLRDTPLYYDTFTTNNIQQEFVPLVTPASSPPPPPPPPPPSSPDVEVVVKGLPEAQSGPRPGLWSPPALCDDKIEPPCITVVPGFPGCLEDPEYPTTSLQFALFQDPLKSKKLPDQPHFDRDYPVDAKINYFRGYISPYSPQHWEDYKGFLCPSKVEFVRPLRLRNTEGRWRVILNNVATLSQTVRLETCLTAGGGCRLLPPCYQSHCTQLHTFHRLLSYNPCQPDQGLTIDTFRLPSGCSCAIGS